MIEKWKVDTSLHASKRMTVFSSTYGREAYTRTRKYKQSRNAEQDPSWRSRQCWAVAQDARGGRSTDMERWGLHPEDIAAKSAGFHFMRQQKPSRAAIAQVAMYELSGWKVLGPRLVSLFAESFNSGKEATFLSSGSLLNVWRG